MLRKLASIQRALQIAPIEGADAIELVRINGWQCVTKKDEFQVGDLGVFFEIDAVPPDSDMFRFLWTSRLDTPATIVERPAKFRIRTMKLRGALSQGLFMPLQTFDLNAATVTEGEDVTAQLGVGKYEAPLPAGMGDARALFPGFVRKTDEERVQSAPAVLDELRGLPYAATLKCDGTSATFVIDPRDREFHACGRNFSIKNGPNFYWNAARQHDLEPILRRSPHLALQGEICGPGIQKNRLGLKMPGLFVFNVWNIQTARYLDHDAMREFCLDNGLRPVEEVERAESFEHTLESLLKLAEGKYEGTSNEREGIIVRPLQERTSPALAGRLSFKAISNRFLLKEGD